MSPLPLIVLSTWTARDLWRWGLIAMGAVLVAHGLLSKNMRMRDGTWRGVIVTKRWQVIYMRTLFTLIGAASIVCALSPTVP